MVGLNRTADRQRKEPFHSHLEHHYMQMSVSCGMLTPTLGVWHGVKTLESAHSQYLQCGFLKIPEVLSVSPRGRTNRFCVSRLIRYVEPGCCTGGSPQTFLRKCSIKIYP